MSIRSKSATPWPASRLNGMTLVGERELSPGLKVAHARARKPTRPDRRLAVSSIPFKVDQCLSTEVTGLAQAKMRACDGREFGAEQLFGLEARKTPSTVADCHVHRSTAEIHRLVGSM